LGVLQQQQIAVHYDDVVVGEYAVDLLVEGSVMVELKAIRALGACQKSCVRGRFHVDDPFRRG
jgi:GxxExxY protein